MRLGPFTPLQSSNLNKTITVKKKICNCKVSLLTGYILTFSKFFHSPTYSSPRFVYHRSGIINVIRIINNAYSHIYMTKHCMRRDILIPNVINHISLRCNLCACVCENIILSSWIRISLQHYLYLHIAL